MAWQRVSVIVAGAHAEALAEALEEAGAVSTDIADAEAGTPDEHAVFAEPGADSGLWSRCRVTALFPAGTNLDKALGDVLDATGVRNVAAASVDRLEDADWVTLTQRQFEPIQAGERLWIVPTWHEPPRRDAINIILDPGAAFGTGSHPTTRLCLAWLEANVRPGDRVLDYGCGSGILAIAALKLGAGDAWAVDVDPLALQAAQYNAQRNGVRLEIFDAATALPGTARITVANILANPLRMLAPLIAAHTEPGGAMALSGVLAEQAGDVIAAYAPWAELSIAKDEAGWVLLAGKRRG